MASRTLYPPLVESNLPAFMAGEGTLNFPISFSKFNNLSEIASAQVSITKKDTGESVINTVNAEGRYRATGIILNVPLESTTTIDGQTSYFISINADDLKNKVNDQIGWIPGWYYKIQVRLSAINYEGTVGQQAWLNLNASQFSEWSTVCIVKVIGNITLDITSFGCSYSTGNTSPVSGSGSSLTFVGNYSCVDTTETLGYYRVKLFNYPKTTESQPIDDSGYIYNNAVNANEFNYSFKIVPEAGTTQYAVELEYNTINDFNEIINIYYSLIFD